jgi:hypothetical protein
MHQDLVAHFQQHGFVKVPAVLDPDLCELISSYLRLKASTKVKVRRGNDPLSGIHREYADPLMETLLSQYLPIVEQATGLALWPTLSFSYHYVNGNVLQPHKDRECCEIVAGLCIGADEKYKHTNKPWPLQIKGVNTIDLNYGDMLIFKGHTMEHWRDVFTGEWFVSAIFGYVDQNGPYAYQKFDQRKALGHKHIGMLAWMLGLLKARLLNSR